jgi:hypothetical protein
MQLRQLARRLEYHAPSPERDELLHRTRLRLVEIEARELFGPPTSHPALSTQADPGPGSSRLTRCAR